MKCRFLCLLAILIATASCQDESRCITEGVAVEISGNHGHEVTVPSARVKRAVGGNYRLRGGSHKHLMRLTSEAMKGLLEGQSAVARASSSNAHTHELKVSCK